MKENPIINNNEEICFLDYKVHLAQRKISKNKQDLHLSKKSFEILSALLSSESGTLTKEQLIAKVWPQQIVTDAALNKQVARLRHALGDSSESPKVIETLRGVGIRFLPKTHQAKSQTSKNLPGIALLVLSLLALIIYGNYFFINSPPATEVLENKPSEVKRLTIAFVPAQPANDWINVGGTNYLSDLIYQQALVNTINPKTQWFQSEAPETIAVELAQSSEFDFVAALNITQNDTDAMAHITLRTRQGVMAKTSVEAASLSLLFEKLQTWVVRQLQIENTLSQGKIHGYKPSDFALESYLRGLEMARNNSYEKAIPFLQTAINEDPGFFTAGILLVELEAELGNFQKAKALLEVMNQRTDFDTDLKNRLLDAQATVHLYLNDLDASQSYLNESMKLSEKIGDMKALIRSLTTQAIIYFSKNETDPRVLTTLEKQMEFIEDYNPDPYFIALAKFNLAVSYQVNRQLDSAIDAIKDAIKIYTRHDNKIGLVSANSILSELYYELGQYAVSLNVLKGLDKMFQTIDGVHDQIIFYKSKIRALAANGYLSEALHNSDLLEQLGLDKTLSEAIVMAHSLRAETYQRYNLADKAESSLKRMKQAIDSIPEEENQRFQRIHFFQKLYQMAHHEDFPGLQAQLQELDKNSDDLKPHSYDIRYLHGLTLLHEGSSSIEDEALKQQLKELLKKNEIEKAQWLAYDLLRHYLNTGSEDFVPLLNQMDEKISFKYPIQKYRAQWLESQNQHQQAYVLMNELKSLAGEFWTVNDQLLMEHYLSLASDSQNTTR